MARLLDLSSAQVRQRSKSQAKQQKRLVPSLAMAAPPLMVGQVGEASH